MNTLRIGDLVRVATTTEALTLIALDGEEAWLRDDAGNHLCERVEDLERVHSKAWDRAKREEIAA